jgi:hypothetical protein
VTVWPVASVTGVPAEHPASPLAPLLLPDPLPLPDELPELDPLLLPELVELPPLDEPLPLPLPLDPSLLPPEELPPSLDSTFALLPQASPARSDRPHRDNARTGREGEAMLPPHYEPGRAGCDPHGPIVMVPIVPA